MQCDKCGNEAVFFQSYSGRHLCGRHLVLDIEARAKRTIRSHRWMKSGDHFAVLVSGDRQSAALLCFLKNLIAERRDIRLSALLPGDDSTGRDQRSAAGDIADSLGIPCTGLSSPAGSGDTGSRPVTRIALAVSLDDIAQAVLRGFLFGSTGRIVNPAPGLWNGVPVICPFIAIPSEELDLYWEIEGSGMEIQPGKPGGDALSQETRLLLGDYSRRHPATKYALLHLAEQLSNGDIAAIATASALCQDATQDGNGTPKRPNS